MSIYKYIYKCLVTVAAFIAVVVFFSCNEFRKNQSHLQVPDSTIAKGKILAGKYCQSCHLLPNPEMLDASSWEKGVLPAMGPRLGIFKFNFQHYPSYKTDTLVNANFYPAAPLLSLDEWHSIISYYSALSPDSLPAQKRSKQIQANLSLFDVLVPDETHLSPATCFVKIDTASSSDKLMTFDLATQELSFFDNKLVQRGSYKMNAAVVDMVSDTNGWLACNMGMVNPNNGKFGKAQFIRRDIDGIASLDTTTIFDKLARPVQITSCDLNNDKKQDYVVCEFGNLTGGLSWMENTGGTKFTRHEMLALPGAIKAYVQDCNGDGLQDVWALFAQGGEGIFLFTNLGNGKFSQRQVLRFSPVNGSTYFELADFNKDGHPDIVYTCGDNADYSMVLKPYHGLYIYVNDGKNNFTQQYFYPINGCFKAMAADFDQDGDLDIATIAFFADYAGQPEEGFVYFQNKGSLDFVPRTNSKLVAGRWLTMDVGDINKDGWPDIVLGNFSIRPSFIKAVVDWQKGPPFIVLKNVGK